MSETISTRRDFLKAVAGGISLGALPGCLGSPLAGLRGQTDKDQPNILFVMSDDHACNAISSYGGHLAGVTHTSNIDRLAREGMRLTNCFCTNSICAPSRAAIMTGQYSHINGVRTITPSAQWHEDNPNIFDGRRSNIAKYLRTAGYQTAIIGKWHLDSVPTGFDYWCILPAQGRYIDPEFAEVNPAYEPDPNNPRNYLTVKRVDSRQMVNPELAQLGIADTNVLKGHSTDIVADKAIDWMRDCDKTRPFFLMCHFKAPHRNWIPAPRYQHLYEDMDIPAPANLQDDYRNRSEAAAKATLKIDENMNKGDLKAVPPEGLSREEKRQWCYQRYLKDYLRCIAGVNDNVGRILDFLDARGLTENTVVIYTSDQGMFLGEHGYFDKRFMYEESLRMPFLIRYPGEIKPAGLNNDMIVNIDFAPLLLDYAGIPTPADMQGRSFRSNLRGSTPPDWPDSIYYRYWMHMAHHGVPAHYGVRTDRYKLIFYYGLPLDAIGAVKRPTQPEWELFDLQKDPHEMNNIYHDPSYSQVVKQLKTKLLAHKKRLGDTDERYPELMKIRNQYW